MDLHHALLNLKSQLSGDLFTDELYTTLYATDASIYEERPVGVAIPKTLEDLRHLVKFATDHKIGLIPRGAGTSLAGQVVGHGLVVDSSKYFNRILEINPQDQYAWVEPGVNRDELNLALKSHGLLFGPETSTSNRCTLGGMIGNNSCGSRSLVFGSTRDKLIEVQVLCSNGALVTFGPQNLHESGYAHNLLTQCLEILSEDRLRELIAERFPKTTIRRRNHGYALDSLLASNHFSADSKKAANLCELIAGSEGTLGIIVAAKLALDFELPKHQALLCIHCNSIDESLRANVIAVGFQPTASELMDDVILDCTKNQIEQRENRFFVNGNPKAILVVEFAEKSEEALKLKLNRLKNKLQEYSLGYHYALVEGDDMTKVWELRKAGLGLLSNLPGKAKPIAFIEDTAVDVEDLPEYINAFNALLKKRSLSAVHYAHAGSGELHLRPVLDLSNPKDLSHFREIADEVADLVKRFGGSLSGEHGDGRLRGGFIEKMYGKEIYQAFEKVKELFDPQHIFNPNKIIRVPPIDQDLRAGKLATKHIAPNIRNPEGQSLYDSVNNCTGSGDCLKSKAFAGVMCPSYMATRKELDSTRGRANVLRDMLRKAKPNPHSSEVKDALKLCLSCKACKRECPSNVDMARYKSEVLHLQQQKKFALKPYLIARLHWINNLPCKNTAMQLAAPLLKPLLHIHPKRELPIPARNASFPTDEQVDLWIFVDEFTRLERPQIYSDTKVLLNRMGFKVGVLPIKNSARSAISVGQLKYAKKTIDGNLQALQGLRQKPIVGLEPSAVLGLVDEYPDLCSEQWQDLANDVASRTFTLEKFLLMHVHLLPPLRFDRKVLIHSHCHQKAIEGRGMLKKVLDTKGIDAEELDSGCCGMAGFFGFDRQNYEVSKQIAENKLLPGIAKAPKEHLLVGSGISCQQQLRDLKGIQLLHPAGLFAKLMDFSS